MSPGNRAALANGAVPIFEKPQDGGGGIEAFQSVVAAEEKGAKMPAIGIAQAAGAVIIFGEEESGVGAVGGIFEKELVDGAQEMLRLIESDGALAAQIRLQIGHQESSGDSFSGNVADHEAEPLAAEIEEIVIIAADLASLDADAGVLERGQGRQRLREEPGLHLFGNFQFLGRAAFGFELLGHGAALRFDFAAQLIEFHQREGISIEIFEAGEHAAPYGCLVCGRCRLILAAHT